MVNGTQNQFRSFTKAFLFCIGSIWKLSDFEASALTTSLSIHIIVYPDEAASKIRKQQYTISIIASVVHFLVSMFELHHSRCIFNFCVWWHKIFCCLVLCPMWLWNSVKKGILWHFHWWRSWEGRWFQMWWIFEVWGHQELHRRRGV